MKPSHNALHEFDHVENIPTVCPDHYPAFSVLTAGTPPSCDPAHKSGGSVLSRIKFALIDYPLRFPLSRFVFFPRVYAGTL